MKKLFIFLFTCSLVSIIKAQSVPQGMQYQAIARNSKGEILVNEPVSLRIALVTQGTITEEYYAEIHSAATNQFGLFTLVIGEGTVEKGAFNTIPWSTQNIWLQIAIKDKTQSNFTTISNSKLMAVPYAFYAESSNKSSGLSAQSNASGCACKDGLASMSLLYLGTSGVTVKVFSNSNLKADQLLQTFTNVINGATLTVSPSPRDKKLKDKLFFQIAGSSTAVVEISAKCEDAVVAQTYGNFSVVSRTDVKNGVTCSVCDVQQNWKVGGNVIATPCNWFGSMSNTDVILITNNIPRMTIASGGDITVNNSLSVLKNLDVTGATRLKNTLVTDGITTINNTTESTTKDNGALIVEGGVGIELNLNVGGKVNFKGNSSFEGQLHITDPTQSDNITTGALIVDGGTGIAKNLNVGGSTTVIGATNLNNTLGVTGNTSITNTTQSNTTNEGALIVSGGVGIAKNLNVGGKLDVTGKTRFRDSVTFDKSVATSGQISSSSLAISGDDTSYIAIFQNTNVEKGDGIKIKLGRAKSTYTVNEPTYTTDDLQEMEDFKNLIRCDYKMGLPGEKVSLLKKIAINGAIQDALSIAGIAVSAGNKIVDFININLGLPLVIPSLDIPAISVPQLDLPDFTFDRSWFPKAITIPGFKILDAHEITPAFHLLDATTVMPKLPTIVIPGVPVTDIFDISFWGIPNICLDDAAGTSPLNNENEFIRFADKNDKKVGSIRSVSVANWAANYLNPLFLYKLRGAFLSSKVDKFHAQYHFKDVISAALKTYATIGVEYSSGNGDYAEWLERLDKTEIINAGDIVGVTAGKITKNLKGAEQVMVVSSNPIILGNMPAEGKNFQGNNIAFMGQVPVKMVGPVTTGDYIIGQSNTPGYGIAKHPNKMTIDDFKNAVGRSWVTDETDEPKMVNTVVGVHNNNFVNIIKELKERTDKNEERLKTIENRLNMPGLLKSKISQKQRLK